MTAHICDVGTPYSLSSSPDILTIVDEIANVPAESALAGATSSYSSSNNIELTFKPGREGTTLVLEIKASFVNVSSYYWQINYKNGQIGKTENVNSNLINQLKLTYENYFFSENCR